MGEAAIFYLFWTLKGWIVYIRGSMRSCGIRAFGWKLHGREFSKRARGSAGAANGIGTGIGNELFADVSVCDSSTGIFYQCTGDCCKYHLLIKRNQCVFSNQPDISCSQYGIRNFTWDD